MFKKLTSIFLSTALVIVSTISVGAAQSPVDNTAAEAHIQTLETFLTALKDGNTAQAFSVLTDTRFDLVEDLDFRSLSVSEKKEVNDRNAGEKLLEAYQNHPMSNFTITENSSVLDPSTMVTLVDVVYQDGCEELVPFRTISTNDGNKVLIDEQDVSEFGFEVINQTPHPIPPQPRFTVYDEYSFSYLFTTIYGIDTFYLTPGIAAVEGSQYQDNGWPDNTSVSVNYAIVQQEWYGDNVFRSFNHTGYSNFYNTGSGSKTLPNARIRISRSSDNYSGMRVRGGGRVRR